MKQLRITFWAVAMLAVATIGFGNSPTPEQAVKYAKSVLLVKRVVQDNQIHSYVKEVWRSGPGAATRPAVGTEYGRPTPTQPAARFPESDAIVFEFGANRADGLPNTLRIPVTEKRRVPFFLEEVPVTDDAGLIKRLVEEPMHVDDVRARVKRTKLQPES